MQHCWYTEEPSTSRTSYYEPTSPPCILNHDSPHKNGKSFQLAQNTCCQTENVIYALFCKVCQNVYVGKTNIELTSGTTVTFQSVDTSTIAKSPTTKTYKRASSQKWEDTQTGLLPCKKHEKNGGCTHYNLTNPLVWIRGNEIIYHP